MLSQIGTTGECLSLRMGLGYCINEWTICFGTIEAFSFIDVLAMFTQTCSVFKSPHTVRLTVVQTKA